MKKHERADTDGEHDHGADGTSSEGQASDERSRSISDHASDHPHEGHDGTQNEAHSQPKHGGTHHDMASRHASGEAPHDTKSSRH